ncbi:MAG TPA: RDD family protein [Thermoleophilaceae bacterium]|nr:RDD family protein [Thermoleophilaceae bacterium]
MELASWWSRVGAWLLDALIRVLLAGAAFGLLIAVDSVGGVVDTVGTIVLAPAVVIVYFGYPALTMRRPGARNGQTWGKQIVGIRAVRDDGAAYGLGTALVRELLIKELLIGFVGAIAFSIPFLLDSLWPLWDETNRAVHDMIAHSHVVRA